MPTVATGDAVYPVLTTNADAGTPAKDAAQAETTGAFSANVLTPSRIQASFLLQHARIKPVSAVWAKRCEANLSDALADKLDQQILNGGSGFA